jgi:putative endonuclease
MTGYTYIMANRRNNVMYVEATANLKQRVYQHKTKFSLNSFSARYRLQKFIYYEVFDDLEAAFVRERKIKFMNRQEKKEMITRFNPEWRDLYSEILK